MPQPADWGERSVERQDGVPGSFLELYRQALRLRRHHLRGNDDLQWIAGQPDGVLGFRRGSGVMCVANLGPDPVDLPPHETVLLASGDAAGGRLAPNQAVWLT